MIEAIQSVNMHSECQVVTTQRLDDKEKGLQGAELEVASLNRWENIKIPVNLGRHV